MDRRYIKIMGICVVIVGFIFALPLAVLEIPLSIGVFFIGMILFAVKPKPQPVRVRRKDRWM
ncbi:hypothetical protein P7H00_06265 [Enterococcus pseudoavium]|uniref:Uncharacterized protein n=1 Tax=Enterococcus pseudoavium TaxID=44007 RepID=A0AAE4L692_9ENTE|nr:hypothetical protein [Enterococcus pseudoavium]MDT2736742.1 hypothetical protein [Enterococcus pseudoavium]MDT2755118.1 hypothetical protein [Enterococcus pseudoavium]MDT2770801.1 hypothetical protein [Enterococcus pseudoavium]REC31864.1 hypothetical protein CF160_05095 [Enterococcus pseudoavium]